MNILSIAPYSFLPATDGGKICIYNLYKYIGQYANLHCINTKNNSGSQKLNYTLHPILSTSSFRYVNVFLLFTCIKLIKKHQITHVLLEHPYLGWLAFLLKISTSCKVVIHSHNIEATRFKSMGKPWWRLLFYYEKFTYRLAHHVFFITEEDKLWAEKNYGLDAQKLSVATFGTALTKPISLEEKLACRKQICTTYNISQDCPIYIFTGSLGYKPNLQAVDFILQHIYPALQQILPKFVIMICGGNLPEKYNNLKSYEHVIYTGFVADITTYVKAATLFLNPVTEGGGIKTKLVEALACNTPAVSTQSGAIGVTKTIAGNSLLVVPDNDLVQFVESILTATYTEENELQTPAVFYNYFAWSKIAEKVVGTLTTL